MQLIFYLNDVEIDEPIGFGGIELSIIRDEEFHGIGFEASTGTLEFHGNGADILRTAKETSGIAASVIFRAEVICNAYQEEENIYTGRVNFGMYSEKCGDSCTVSVGVEEDSCIVTLRNRMDQKVDVDSLVAFDKQTALADYVMMGEEVTLPPVELFAEDWAELTEAQSEDLVLQDWSDNIVPQGMNAYLGPAFNNTKFDALGVFYVDVIPALYNGGANNRPPYLTMPPTVVLSQNAGVTLPCNYTDVLISFRISGTIDQIEATPTANTEVTFKIFRLPVDQDPSVVGNWVEEMSQEITSGPLVNTETDDFFFESAALIAASQGDQIWVGVYILTNDADTISSFVWNQNEGDYLRITANVLCEETTTESYLIHETLSRVTESITNSCARVKSSYFGRTESEPFAFSEDGCGGLRFLTSGLKIRRAEKDYFFASFQQLIDGLNAIDNIGFGIEDDPVLPNKKVVRIENVGYFYQDSILLTLPSIPRAQSEIKEDMYYSLIKIGYKRWEVERINGLDEFNSTREYRTSFDTVNKTLEQESELVAGSYAIELTRQQSFNSTGAADTSYDNEIFIVCVGRLAYNTFAVEVNVTGISTNVYSPSTKYNVRISPARNMMRWYKSTANGYVNISDTSNKIFFGSGTGNIAACIKMLNNAYVDGCVNEDSVLCENQDIHIGDFLDQANGAPIWKNETLAFEYPLSVSDYRTIKAAPYGKIRFQCGQGDFEEGYIKEVKFRPIDGTASFTLIKKY